MGLREGRRMEVGGKRGWEGEGRRGELCLVLDAEAIWYCGTKMVDDVLLHEFSLEKVPRGVAPQY